MRLSDVIHSPAPVPFRSHLDIPANCPCRGSLYFAYGDSATSTFRCARAHGKKITIISGSDPHLEERKL